MPTLSNKGKITKELCDSSLEKLIKKDTLIFGAIAIIFGALNIHTALSFAVVFIIIGIAIILFGIYKSNETKKCIERRNYYLTEDIVIKAKERHVSTSHSSHRNILHTFTFKDQGEYTITNSAPHFVQIKFLNDTEAIDLDAEALKYFCEGEIFYVLVLEIGKRRQIAQIFNACCFDIEISDFNELEGKYYPKLS